MNFSKWYAEMDQQNAPLPDARQFSYLACVLDLLSQNHLEAVVRKWLLSQGQDFPADWTIRAHHMTVKFGVTTQDMEIYKQYFGEDVHLIVAGIAYDKNCVAVKVKPSVNFPMQPNPHITVAHSRAVSPVYSNTLLADPHNIKHIDTVDLNSVFAAVKKDQKNIWPEKLFPLAVPVKVQ